MRNAGRYGGTPTSGNLLRSYGCNGMVGRHGLGSPRRVPVPAVGSVVEREEGCIPPLRERSHIVKKLLDSYFVCTRLYAIGERRARSRPSVEVRDLPMLEAGHVECPSRHATSDLTSSGGNSSSRHQPFTMCK